MQTCEAIGNITGAQRGATLGVAAAPTLLPIELNFDKTNTITVQILSRIKPVRVRAFMDVLVAYDDSGTKTVSVGSGAGTNIFNAQTVAVAGTFTGNAIFIEDDTVDIMVNYNGENGDHTAGRVIVYLEVTPLTLIRQDA